MKMYMVVYSKAVDYDVMGKVKQAGICCYTKMESAHGEGVDSEPKLGTHVWPGENNVLFMAVSEEEVAVVKELIRQVKQDHPRAGVKGFLMPMEESV